MAISQHQFYLDRKQSKAKIPAARSLDDLAMELTENGTSRISKMVDGKNPLIMASSGSLISSGSIDSEVSEEQKTEKIQELKKKEKDLQDVLLKKIEELKKICMREAELTGTLPSEYPLIPGEKPPNVRRRMGTTFKLHDDILLADEDSDLQNLEHKFLIQQQMVEATKKLLMEPDLSKNVKRKRKQDYSDAIKRLQDIESAINEFRVKSGKDPTKRASLLIQDDIIPSESSSLSDTATFDDDDSLYLQGQKSCSLQNSPQKLRGTKSLGDRSLSRKSSLNDQFSDMRISGHREPTSTHSSPYKTAERKPHGGRSVPSTPVLTRNAYSSNHLQNEGTSYQSRERRGSLESHTPLMDELEGSTTFPLSKSQRSSSTEVLDDGSSYTSQSSSEYYSTPPKQHPCYTTQTLDNRARDRRRHKKQNFSAANTGSMPNLAHKDTRNGVYQITQNQPSSSYYFPGYSSYLDTDPYYNGGYIYENDTEGQYNVNPSYRSSAHYAYDHYRDVRYDGDQFVPQHPYATLRPPPRKKAPAKTTEQITKNIHKAIVAEHLRGWYQRASCQKEPIHGLPGMEPERGSQRSLCYSSSLQIPSSPSIRTPACASVSANTTPQRWAHNSTMAYPEYNNAPHSQYSGYSTAYSSIPLPSRSFMAYPSQQDDPDISPLAGDALPPDQDILWHEDSKPGTLV